MSAGSVFPPQHVLTGTGSRAGRRWILFPEGIILSRPAEAVGTARYLAGPVRPSGDPESAIPQVSLFIHEMTTSADAEADPACRALLLAEGVHEIAVNLETGQICDTAWRWNPGRVPASDELLSWVRQELDGVLLDGLYALWQRSGGWTPRVHWDYLLRREPGERIDWSLAFPDDREDHYELEGQLFLARESFSLDRERDGDEFVIGFAVVEGRDARIREVGSAVVGLREGHEIRLEARLGRDEQLALAWGAYRTRHRHFRERLVARRLHLLQRIAERRSPAREEMH